MIIILKVHRDRLGLGAYLCVELNYPRSLIKKVLAKQKMANSYLTE